MELTVPCSTYHYKQLAASETEAMGPEYKDFGYRLLGIEASAKALQISIDGIERSTLEGHDLAQLQIFNEVYISECNTVSLRLVFHDLDGFTRACTATSNGKLRVEAVEPREGEAPALPAAAIRPETDGDGDVYFAASAYTLVHDYAETRAGRCFHVGLSLLPVGPLFLPLWLSGDRMRRALFEWQAPRFEAAKRESLLTVRWLRGECSVRHVLARVPEKNDPLPR